MCVAAGPPLPSPPRLKLATFTLLQNMQYNKPNSNAHSFSSLAQYLRSTAYSKMNSKLFDPEGIPELHPANDKAGGSTHDHRSLGSNYGDFQSLLVDNNGNEYDPYSLAWRYLGLYVDCDVDINSDVYYYRNRKLKEGENNGGCQRKLLWAAYVDHGYKGNAIKEYSFYDIATGEYDDAACQASGKRHQCARMDCHEPHTHVKLVGVFKETEGMYDWTEKLFKHEGICVWNDDDAYETMETWMENWPTSCTQLNMPDDYGNRLCEFLSKVIL